MLKKIVLCGDELDKLVKKHEIREALGKNFPELNEVVAGETFEVSILKVTPLDEYDQDVAIELVFASKNTHLVFGANIITVAIYDGSAPISCGDQVCPLPDQFNTDVIKLVHEAGVLAGL